jgi:transcriptional regulator with XRE-family HTH domain
VKRPANAKKQKRVKALEARAKTIGDWMRAKRLAKNLRPFHVAGKMGIATSLVLAWERGIQTPDERQWQTLSDLLSFDLGMALPKPGASCGHVAPA